MVNLQIHIEIDELPEGGWHAITSHRDPGSPMDQLPIIAHTGPSLCNKIAKRLRRLIQEALKAKPES